MQPTTIGTEYALLILAQLMGTLRFAHHVNHMDNFVSLRLIGR
jgi:hypothetical protein